VGVVPPGAIAFDLATKPMPGQGAESDVLFPLTTGAFPIASILILSRQPRNVIGWILMAIGLGWALPLGNYGDFAVSRHLPGGFIAVSLSSPTWAPPIVLMGTSLLLRFPNGTLLSPRWRKVEWLAAITLVATMVAIVLAPGKLTDSGYANVENPLGIEALKPVFNLVIPLIFLMGIGRAIGSDRNLTLSILATALVAVAFQPVRERVQRFANRLVYGKRATPYEVLSEFSGGIRKGNQGSHPGRRRRWGAHGGGGRRRHRRRQPVPRFRFARTSG